MRLALLGADDQTLALVAAAGQNQRDELAFVDSTAARAAEAQSMAPRAKALADWEQALDSQQIDAVVVSSDQPELRIEQLRRLIQTAMPALVSHPVSLSVLDCYELEMIERDSPSVVLPNLPARWHPAAEELRLFVDADDQSPLGRIEQVVFERQMAGRDRDQVLRQFARDADLLQFIAGQATKLHALGSPDRAGTTGPYGNLNVQLSCAQGVVCRWSVAPVERQPGGRLTLIGPQGKVVVWMPAEGSAWTIEVFVDGKTTSRTYPDWNAATAALEKLEEAKAGADIEPTWSEAARCVELADNIEVSLRRGRNIELHHEEFSDIGTFKGTMASVGCGILIVGLVVVFAVGFLHAVAVQAGWQGLAAALGIWPYLMLAVLGVYLLLQLVVYFVKPVPPADAKPPSDA